MYSISIVYIYSIGIRYTMVLSGNGKSPTYLRVSIVMGVPQNGWFKEWNFLCLHRFFWYPQFFGKPHLGNVQSGATDEIIIGYP